MDGDQKFPRWAGPVIGAGLGVMFAMRAMREEGQSDWLYPVGGGLLGALAGGVMWLLDAPLTAGRPASSMGSVLAVLAVFPGMIPFIGLVFGVAAFLMNRQVCGWQNTSSRLGLGLGIVLSAVVIAVMMTPL